MSGRSSRSTLIATKFSLITWARSGSSYDSRSITWHQWHHVAPMSRRIGRSSSFARPNASSPHGCQSTGWFAAPLRYVDVSRARRFFPMGGAQARAPLSAFGCRHRRLQLRRELLPELRDLRRDDRAAVARRRVLAEVVLVVFLGSIECGQGHELRHERMGPELRVLELSDDLLRGRLLVV